MWKNMALQVTHMAISLLMAKYVIYYISKWADTVNVAHRCIFNHFYYFQLQKDPFILFRSYWSYFLNDSPKKAD